MARSGAREQGRVDMPPKRRIGPETNQAARSKQLDRQYKAAHPRTRTPGPDRRRPKQLWGLRQPGPGPIAATASPRKIKLAIAVI